jgi:DHA2 family multidrug resistance protein
MMPIIGKLIQRGSARIHGFRVSNFLFFTLMMRNNMTPDTGVEHLYWSLIFEGIGLGLLLFLLLLYHYPLCQEKNIGEGAAFTGMMRQEEVLSLPLLLFITRFSQEHRVNLVAHI